MTVPDNQRWIATIPPMSADFAITRRVQFYETDMAGVVHFSNYFRMMEEVEHEFFRSIGLSVSMDLDGQTISWPRVSATCEYEGPVRFEDSIELRLRITKLGRKSLSYEVDFHCRGRRVALGKLTSVCCALHGAAFEAIPIPTLIREKLEAHHARPR